MITHGYLFQKDATNLSAGPPLCGLLYVIDTWQLLVCCAFAVLLAVGHSALSAEEIRLTGLAREYQEADLVAVVVIDASPRAKEKFHVSWIKKPQSERDAAVDMNRLVGDPGRCLIFAVLKDSHVELKRLLHADAGNRLTQYIGELKKYNDSNKEVPVEFYYKHVESSNADVSRDSLNGCLAAPLRTVEMFASSKLKANDLIDRLRKLRNMDDNTVRLYAILIAHASGETTKKAAVLDEFVLEAMQNNLINPRDPIDSLLSGLLVCDPELGESRLKQILRDPSEDLMSRRQLALRAANFGLTFGQIDKRSFDKFIRSHLHLLYPVYPEVLHLARAHEMSLTSVEVAQMAAHPKIMESDDLRWICHRAIAGYYLGADEEWQWNTLKQIAIRDIEALKSVRKSIQRRRGQSGVPSAYLGVDVHRAPNSATCVLGAQVEGQ